ncbi:ATPase [Streptomyces sp. MUSC 125]|nr:ATPase [Streptomyces sp. MUSC 125]MCH0560836.1 ATP-binding protein [Streptomyces sp. MUM 16J]
MRLAVLPPLAVALSATAAVLISVRSAGAHTGPTLWAVLAGAVTVTVAGILIAAVAADRAARSVSDRVDALRRTAARGEAELHALVDALRQGETPPQRHSRRRLPDSADDFELLAADLARAHDGAVTAVVRAAQLSSQAGSEQKLEVFVNLARRLQSLVHREISILDELENEFEDPGLLKGLFHVDHLATRIRRHAENLAVLGGAVSRRQWSNPVNMTEVLRSAIAEVEQYSRVKLAPPIDGELRGHAVADVIHLLAELVENATVFSAPHTQVLLRANLVTSGLAVEVEDRGLGMPAAEQHRMNTLLTDPDQVNVASLLADGRIGLYVVSQLARRHGITVRLQTNIYGGVQAVLVIPEALLGSAPGASGGAEEGAETEQDPAGTGASRQVQEAQPPVPPPVRVTEDQPEADEPARSQLQPQRPAGSASPPPTGGGAADGAGAGAGAGPGSAPVGGRRRHAQRGPVRRGAEGSSGRHAAEGGSGRDSDVDVEGARKAGAPAPLPVRGARGARPTPAEAVPGVNAQDRQVVENHAGIAPTPRAGSVCSTEDKPQLPRRRALEHIVPELRGGPAPRQGGDSVAVHDPGLMAAFQRGIGLAEAQQHMEAVYEEPPSGEPMYGASTYAEPQHMGPAHTASPHAAPAYLGSADMTSSPMPSLHSAASHADAVHMDAAHTGGGHLQFSAPESTEPAHARSGHGGTDQAAPGFTDPSYGASEHSGSGHMAPDHLRPDHAASEHTTSEHTVPDNTVPGHITPSPILQARAHGPASEGNRGTSRTDGSAPAG